MSIPLRRARLLWCHRRLGVQDDLPRIAGDGEARHLERAGHRRRQSRLEPRSTQSARARQHREARRHRSPLPSTSSVACCATSTATMATRRPFMRICKELGGAKRPAHYLAIPPLLFETVVEQLAKSGCTEGARVIVEKPFGQDLDSAQHLNRMLLAHLRRDRRSFASTTTSASGRCTT